MIPDPARFTQAQAELRALRISVQIGLLILASVGPLALYLWRVETPRRAAIERERDALNDLYRRTQECKAARGQFAQFEQEVRQLNVQSQTLQAILPAAPQTFPPLDREVRDLATESGLEVRSLRPLELARCGRVTEFPFRVELMGTYPGLVSFLAALPSHRRLTLYADLHLERTPAGTYHLDLEFRRFALPLGP